MRPPRVVLLVFFCFASLFFFCRAIISLATVKYRSANPDASIASPPVPQERPPSPPNKSSLRSFFSFSAPFALFPPNAIISLTDDNSTSFQARPAAFGPPLPQKGLSGQLWIGSGFADDNLPEGEGEGELGCSDVPGWEDGAAGLGLARLKPPIKPGFKKSSKLAAAVDSKSGKNAKRDSGNDKGDVDRKGRLDTSEDASSSNLSQSKSRLLDDGTDDYLHQGLQRSSPDKNPSSGTTHADIQSIQEAAEITGKVVLLSRGGCGFLEKVKWAQRRGAVAVIVGDNTKGGPLIQMFARGDTSNVTIPATFTSRTTAHILSSLMQPGSYIEDIIDDSGKPVVKVQQPDKGSKVRKNSAQQTKAQSVKKSTTQGTDTSKAPSNKPQSRGWFSTLFKWGGSSGGSESKRSQDWVLVDDWSDEKDKAIRTSMENAAKKSRGGADDFVIGVQDWRDPDLVESLSQQQDNQASAGKDKGGGNGDGKGSKKPVSGITPGSGEYVPEMPNGKAGASRAKDVAAKVGFMSKMFGGDGGSEKHAGPSSQGTSTTESSEEPDAPEGREGLWVTITPTASVTPFLDTVLVLVVSPLVTLSVVYALLILRAKLRRRRWRAPKSVVERLPVRTYHTVASSSSGSSRLPSPTSSSPTTPLLQQQNQQPPSPLAQVQASSSRPRPRSRTTTGVPDSSDSMMRIDTDLQPPRTPTRTGRREKTRPHFSSEWKKYMGRQVECVVCLEEYVDGVSRVMSLPCGHEFHVECITPWLTTRRRTCPICKGDVVRSLARGSPSSPRYDAYRDDSEDSEDSASGPGSGTSRPGSPSGADEDLERGILSSSPGRRSPRSRPSRAEGWLGMISSYVRIGPAARSARENQDDRRIR